MTRRFVLISATASVAAMACGGDDDPAGSGGGTTTSNGGNGGTTSTGGNGGTGGTGTGGTGGMGTGGMGTGGMAGVCGTMLVARGSNYGSDPHDLTIPVADIEEGVTKTYPTTGQSHTHDVTITAADFAALKNGEVVRVYTCFANPNFTDHEFILDCNNPDNTSMLDGEIGDENMCGP